MNLREHVVMLVGGVGGAKLALGMAQLLPAESLTLIVNTADDFEHLSLHISPDLDTVTYTLSQLANPKTGWGIAGDSFRAMEMVERLGGPTWFNLGDVDLGTNLMRTAMLRAGKSLTEVTQHITQALEIKHTILPMADERICTILDTMEFGELGFQEYFVRERWQPEVTAIYFKNAEEAHITEQVAQALSNATLIVFSPSNPFLSIDPILAVPGIRDCIRTATVPRVAISPVIAGKAVKGPTVKLMYELDKDASPIGVSEHYHDLLNGIILDTADRDLIPQLQKNNVQATSYPILMKSLDDKIKLAEFLLDWSEENLL